MDHINDWLTEDALDDTLSPAISAALGLAKKTLNRYYSRMDDSEAYRIAMSKFIKVAENIKDLSVVTVLHPQYKLEYFKAANWEQEWIEIAENILRIEFSSNYEGSVNLEVPDSPVTVCGLNYTPMSIY